MTELTIRCPHCGNTNYEEKWDDVDNLNDNEIGYSVGCYCTECNKEFTTYRVMKCEKISYMDDLGREVKEENVH